MLEKNVEAYFCRQVKERLHGKAYKFTSPGNNGVQDRIVIVPPSGRVYFVELKRPGETPRPLQRFVHDEMRNMGCVVLTIDTKSKVDSFIEGVLTGGI